MARLPFEGKILDQLHELLEEGAREILENFGDEERYDRTAPRKLMLEVIFEPEEGNPKDLRLLFRKSLKLPKRLGKAAKASMRDGKLFIDKVPEDEDLPIFGKETPKPRVVGLTKGAENDD